jgi:hypothetical protein
MLAAARFPCFYESVFQQPGSFSVPIHRTVEIAIIPAEPLEPSKLSQTRIKKAGLVEVTCPAASTLLG